MINMTCSYKTKCSPV